MANLGHVIYRSCAIKEFTEQELFEMLQSFRINNELLNVTGMLLYDNAVFLQVIEGEDTIISKLYDSIKADLRHRLVTTLVNEPINARDFSNWSMGFHKVDQQFNDMEGLNDFFTNPDCLTKIDVGIAKKLLQVFAKKHSIHG